MAGLRTLRPLALVATLLAAGAAAQQNLPPGEGRDLVAQKCYACHAFEARVGAGYTAEGWHTVLRGSFWYTGQMANVLGRVDPRTGQVKEFPLKTPHSGPHGLVEDRDGNIWYTGNTGALVGRLDPCTGNVTEYRMPEADATDPHTLVFDRTGILWFTVQNTVTLVKVPK